VNIEPADFNREIAAPITGRRIGVFTEYVELAADEIQKAIHEAVKVFRQLGCAADNVSLPCQRFAVGASFAVMGTEAYALHEPFLRQHGDKYAPDVRRRLLAAAFVTGRDYVNAQRVRRHIQNEIDSVLERYDCLIAPTLAVAAPRVDQREVAINGKAVRVRPAVTMFTRLCNLSGHPVLAVPCGFNSEGLPLSMQIVGRSFDEATILRMGYAYQQATDWHRRRPPCS
jgi:Asp-tRNA(Asn)/Glu-tRNA(Gln) amidotransferase A subunit family amidase